MKKTIADFSVVACESLSPRLFRLRLQPADGSMVAEARPGQFVEVRVDDEPRVFLRRPISIHRIDREHNELWLLVQSAGAGTRRMARLSVGDIVNIVYPLGNGFTLPDVTAADTSRRYLLVGGGVGIAPLLELGHAIVQRGGEVNYLLGVRTASDLVELDEFSGIGKVAVTTEDGTSVDGIDCRRGFVTDHPILHASTFDGGIRVCGPGPMMKAVARVVGEWPEAKRPHYCEVSLENKMACGLGVCLCCVEDTKDGHRCVCSDGPVFDINDLKW